MTQTTVPLPDTDPTLLWLLRRAGDEWGPRGVAETAAALASPPLAQCGRTFRHPRHDTDQGWCAGLDGTEADGSADYARDEQPPAPEPETDPWAIPVPYAVLESGLRVLEDRAGGTCERTVDGALGSCFSAGYTADARYGADRACVPCIAHRVLAGQPLPASVPAETHRAVIEDPLAGRLEVIAVGDEHACRDALSAHLAADPIGDYHRGLIVEVLDHA